MKHYKLSGADAFRHIPEHPERTARKHGFGLDFDVTFQVWPSRAAMLKTIDMQRRRAHRGDDWTAEKLTCQNGPTLL